MKPSILLMAGMGNDFAAGANATAVIANGLVLHFF
jgi:hypothetical protein